MPTPLVLVKAGRLRQRADMPKTSDPAAPARLAAQLRDNLARRKALARERAADPEGSALAPRTMPVHGAGQSDPDS